MTSDYVTCEYLNCTSPYFSLYKGRGYCLHHVRYLCGFDEINPQ